MIEQFYNLRPEVLALDRKALSSAVRSLPMWRKSATTTS